MACGVEWPIATRTTSNRSEQDFFNQNFYFTNQYAETQAVNGIVRSNPKGQKSIIHLPDGTKVHLNSGSVLQYFSDYQSNRYVELEGEAFFEVEKKPENPFVVK